MKTLFITTQHNFPLWIKLHTVFGLDLLEWRQPHIIILLKFLRNVLRFHSRCKGMRHTCDKC